MSRGSQDPSPPFPRSCGCVFTKSAFTWTVPTNDVYTCTHIHVYTVYLIALRLTLLLACPLPKRIAEHPRIKSQDSLVAHKRTSCQVGDSLEGQSPVVRPRGHGWAGPGGRVLSAGKEPSGALYAPPLCCPSSIPLCRPDVCHGPWRWLGLQPSSRLELTYSGLAPSS